MGKARGPKRKEAPARRKIQDGNSGLLHKKKHNQHGGAHQTPGLEGGAAMGKRTLSQQLLQPNKRARGGKRRRKGDGPLPKPNSSEAAVIQAEYADVDARERAKRASEDARRMRAPARVNLAPSSTALRMPSDGDASMASLRASSSARMVEALLHSISDDPAPDAPPSRPVRSAGRKRKGNPYAALGDDDDESDSDGEPSSSMIGLGFSSDVPGGGGRVTTAPDLTFASPSDFKGFSGGDSSCGGLSWGRLSNARRGDEDDDPDL